MSLFRLEQYFETSHEVRKSMDQRAILKRYEKHLQSVQLWLQLEPSSEIATYQLPDQ